MPSLIWIKLRVWFARAKCWIGGALAIGLAYLAFSRRKEIPAAMPEVSKEIADAVRPGLQRMAERARLEREAALQAAHEAHDDALEREQAATVATDEEAIRMFRELDEARRRKRRFGRVFALFLFAFAGSDIAHAQGIACADSITDEACALEHPRTHAPGVWLHMPAFRDVVKDLAALDLRDTRAANRLAANEAAGVELEALRVELTVNRRALEATGAALEAARREREEARAWYRSPWLWGPAGAFVGVVVMGTVAAAVSP